VLRRKRGRDAVGRQRQQRQRGVEPAAMGRPVGRRGCVDVGDRRHCRPAFRALLETE
jgi:hypothetical protein